MNSDNQTRVFLLAHCQAYPRLELTDLFKALYQSACGCEHLVGDASAAAAYITDEAASCKPHSGAVIEPLDGEYVRVHLDILKDGLSADTFARLFACSAEHHDGAKALLEEKLDVLLRLAAKGELPFSLEATRAAVDAWKKAGLPACHHSEPFRRAYAPAYRLMKADYARLLPLLSRIDAALRDSDRVLLALDGACASGKTTLAAFFQRLYGCPLFHMDDFFLRPEQRTPERYAEPGGNVDRERFLAEVLIPLRAGETVQYRRFDCSTFTVLPPKPIAAGRLNVIEGTYSLHPDLEKQYDLSAVLKIPPDLQRERIIMRNGVEMAQRFFDTWIPLEERYFNALRPDLRCTVVLD